MILRLETDRLVLRQIRSEADLDTLYDLFADPEVARYTDTGPFESLAEAEEVMEWIDGIFAKHLGMRWALALKTDEDEMIGTAGYNQWHRWNHSAEIGFDLMRDLWGSGLMVEALRAVLGFGFREMALNRVEADVTVGNEASVRVLDRLGFHQEGLLRQRGFWKGSSHDRLFYSLLREDWDGQFVCGLSEINRLSPTSMATTPTPLGSIERRRGSSTTATPTAPAAPMPASSTATRARARPRRGPQRRVIRKGYLGL